MESELICFFVGSTRSVELLVEWGLEGAESGDVHVDEEGWEGGSYGVTHNPGGKNLRHRFEAWRCLGDILVFVFLLFFSHQPTYINGLFHLLELDLHWLVFIFYLDLRFFFFFFFLAGFIIFGEIGLDEGFEEGKLVADVGV